MVGTALVLMFPVDAWAYIDPGTGSYLFQLVIAGGLAGLYTIRRYWDSLAGAVRAKLSRGEASERARDPHGLD